jgi:hypothetical protein
MSGMSQYTKTCGFHSAMLKLITTHTSCGSDNLQARQNYIVKENIRRFGAGLPLLTVVDKKEGS